MTHADEGGAHKVTSSTSTTVTVTTTEVVRTVLLTDTTTCRVLGTSGFSKSKPACQQLTQQSHETQKTHAEAAGSGVAATLQHDALHHATNEQGMGAIDNPLAALTFTRRSCPEVGSIPSQIAAAGVAGAAVREKNKLKPLVSLAITGIPTVAPSREFSGMERV